MPTPQLRSFHLSEQIQKGREHIRLIPKERPVEAISRSGTRASDRKFIDYFLNQLSQCHASAPASALFADCTHFPQAQITKSVSGISDDPRSNSQYVAIEEGIRGIEDGRPGRNGQDLRRSQIIVRNSALHARSRFAVGPATV